MYLSPSFSIEDRALPEPARGNVLVSLCRPCNDSLQRQESHYGGSFIMDMKGNAGYLNRE